MRIEIHRAQEIIFTAKLGCAKIALALILSVVLRIILKTALLFEYIAAA